MDVLAPREQSKTQKTQTANQKNYTKIPLKNPNKKEINNKREN